MLSDEERLAAAALNLRSVEDVCVPVVLNIIGHYLSAHLKNKTYISDKLNTYCCWSQMKWPLHGYFFPPVCSLISCSISPCVQQV